MCIDSADDLRLIDHLDETLWVASSCPVRGLDIDEKTLGLIDSDQDGRIRPPELKRAISWLFEALADYESIVDGRDWLELNQIDDNGATGQRIKQSALRILENLGRPNDSRITLADAMDRTGIFAKVKSNGDGIIPEEAAESDETKAVIRDIINAMGAETDLSGKPGVTADKVNAFYTAANDYLNWWSEGYPENQEIQAVDEPLVVEEDTSISLEDAVEEHVKAEADVESAGPVVVNEPKVSHLNKDIFPLGVETAAAFGALNALRSKIDEFFVQRKIAVFDSAAVSFFNFRESDLLEAGKRDEKTIQEVMSGLPLARVAVGVDLPLEEGVNPVYLSAVKIFETQVLRPVLGEEKEFLTESDWSRVKEFFKAYEAWIGSKKGAEVESLGAERIAAILRGPEKEAIHALIQLDSALAGEIKAIEEVEKLLRLHRDLFRLVNNTISLSEFYDTRKDGIFQTGVLIIDGCALRMCVEVLDLNAHSAIAQKSGIYLIYLEAKRSDKPKPITVCAAVTSRSAGRLSVGKNGVFYDRKGLDWDARVAKVVVNPISLSEAAWAPFKAIGELITGQIEKITSSRQKALEQQITGSLTKLDKNVSGNPAESLSSQSASKSNAGIGLGGMLAGGGVAIAALSSSFAYIAQQVRSLPDIYFVYTALLVLLFVIGPSMLIGFIKLRRRDVGMILEASGWAINGQMRLNIKLAHDLTHVGHFDKHARKIHYSYLTEDKRTKRRRFWKWLIMMTIIICALLWWFTNH
ncbi:MAG: hypothetical protein AAFX93_11470 [Verrucomicrobiota bacterium]